MYARNSTDTKIEETMAVETMHYIGRVCNDDVHGHDVIL